MFIGPRAVLLWARLVHCAAMTEAELIREYLAERETPCPACGYNLRGSGGERCPECGHSLELRLTRGALSNNPYPPQFEAARVAEYLRTRDIQCPACKHELRGYRGTECPGCQMRLSVWALRPHGLDLPGGKRSRLWLLMQLFGGLIMAPLAVVGLIALLQLLSQLRSL